MQAILGALRARGLSEVTVLSTNPPKTTARFNVPSVPRSPFNRATLRTLRGAKTLILGGGGLIQDGTSVYNLPIYAIFTALAWLFGLKVIGWGQGVEPIWTLLGKLLARFICRSALYFSVRDPGSRRLLGLAGASTDDIAVTADPAFLIRPRSVETRSSRARPQVIFCLRGLSDNHPGLNLHYLLPVGVRHRLGTGWRRPEAEQQAFIAAVSRGIKLCTGELESEALLLPMWPGRDDAMLLAARKGAIEMGADARYIVVGKREEDPARFAGQIAAADMLVSMRLHALVFAATSGVPCIALSYARKVRGLMRMLGKERWVIEVDRRVPPPEELEMKLRQLWAARASVSKEIREAAGRLRASAERDADIIAGLLRD